MARFSLILIIGILALFSCKRTTPTADSIVQRRVDSVLALMTLEEKIGQLNQLNGSWDMTGPAQGADDSLKAEYIKKGWVGSMLNVVGVKNVMAAQKLAIENSRLGIPMIFGLDVIHGFRTIFPVPLAEAASWDLEAIETSSRVAATEAAAAGINWTFAPMVDIARDPRWGRIVEGGGEDPYLGSKIAIARVCGFQGRDLSATNTIVACAKHFAGYGGAEGGRDYNTVDMSERTLHETYLRPFKAAVDAGVGTFMCAFHEIGGVPQSADNSLMNGVLKGDWGFKGFVVSDWGSVVELCNHGIAGTRADAARLAFNAGCDMEMESRTYIDSMKILVEKGYIEEKHIDDAVRRILRIKFMTGLFDNPYAYCDTLRESAIIFTQTNRQLAREVAQKSMVLLKNDGQLLPLPKSLRSVAVIGPLANASHDMLGTWYAYGKGNEAISLYQGMKELLGQGVQVAYAKGCNINDDSTQWFNQAITLARQSEVVILAIGEAGNMCGENKNRSSIDIPGVQLQLAEAVIKANPKTVVVLFNGRPLDLRRINQLAPAIVEAWFPGTMAGPAIADVLTGAYNPSGKLPVSFPHSAGQIPVYYNHKNNGRPYREGWEWGSKYIDIPNEPLYPFGYGLSYTTFEYKDFVLSDSLINPTDTLWAQVSVTNTGLYDGYEVVQLYVRDIVGSVTRPVRELKGFEKVFIAKGETRLVRFPLVVDDLKFFDISMDFKAEPGAFEVFVGGNSRDLLKAGFVLK